MFSHRDSGSSSKHDIEQHSCRRSDKERGAHCHSSATDEHARCTTQTRGTRRWRRRIAVGGAAGFPIHRRGTGACALVLDLGGVRFDAQVRVHFLAVRAAHW